MKKSNAVIMIICTLIITLFVYTASSKLLDYYNFHFGLTESPFIAPFADILAWTIPASEGKSGNALAFIKAYRCLVTPAHKRPDNHCATSALLLSIFVLNYHIEK
ncbi:MauE/DoxX family redox-associated membrane protein [Niastella sp. OAS944]|uniref:MauE/DoxX family redox-associated membrane protein n=1 Tax=Niastella sp. OAS944 TaxID=2664089 RepID=UPI0034707579|nr:Na+/pantothenate symporter [Chitinophagaceae bacterium OAS944]